MKKDSQIGKILTFCLLLINFTSSSQDFKIPKINFDEKSINANDYVKMFNIKDNDCLLIKVGYQIYGADPRYTDYFIIYLNNGNVLKYHVVYGKPDIIKQIRVKSKERNIYWRFLNDSASNNSFKLDKNKLNSTRIPYDEDSPTRRVVGITDGIGIIFEISQNGQHSMYGSENPRSYIEYKVYGYEERQKLLNLAIDFQNLFSKE